MAKQVPKQLVDVVAWIKANPMVVTFCALVVAAPVGSYFASEIFSAGARTEADRRVKAYSALGSTLTSTVELPIPGGESLPLNTLPTAAMVDEYEQIIKQVEADAGVVYEEARAFNAGAGADAKRPVVDASVFPNYDAARTDSVRTPFYRAIQKAYADLLARANAGSPPDQTTLTSAVEAAEKRFVNGELKKSDRSKLDAEELKRLEATLGKARLGRCIDAAKQLSFYCDLSAFGLPSEAEIQQLYKKKDDRPAHDRFLFELQWKLWIATDVVSAFADANAGAAVLQAPVKRLVRLTVNPLLKVQSGSSGEATAMGDAAAATGEVPPGDAAAGEGAAPEGAAAKPAESNGPLGKPVIDATAEAARDFSKGLTGRTSNAVYDVRTAEVTFVAETARLPRIFNALAAQNFMTVTNVRMAPADPFAAARAGFVYGSAPVVEVVATLETVWLREVTAPAMPLAVRTELGIQTETPGSAAGDESAGDGSEGSVAGE